MKVEEVGWGWEPGHSAVSLGKRSVGTYPLLPLLAAVVAAVECSKRLEEIGAAVAGFVHVWWSHDFAAAGHGGLEQAMVWVYCTQSYWDKTEAVGPVAVVFVAVVDKPAAAAVDAVVVERERKKTASLNLDLLQLAE